MLLSQNNFLKHIREEATFIISQTADLTLNDLEQTLILQKALLRSLKVIGEATKLLDSSFRQKYPYIDWKAMAGTRDKLIHDYFNVDIDLVYDICKTNIPALLIDMN